ncbi:Cytochrome P450 E-class group I [Penicillium macrosclerotiorum]|uniref:Cytochrome P450 E-class group I n=1 Tax=Penicillium macrosclerotiorum TaxID=303699 RepID=UPI002546AA0A|nr:Cytochrome P450 E-class group I [Penicillium macrosclerotiorum]KAJ5688948.1 Cytochrome P450 E-class group I [Penicillium macrosclerotiorum]
MSTYYSFDWTMWLMRNFPLTIYFHDIATYLPSYLKFGYEQRNVMTELMTNLLHVNLSSPELKNRATLIGNMTKPGSSRNGAPLPESALLDEAIGVMHGGVLDISNVLPYGTFHLAQDLKSQQTLYEELKQVWEDPAGPIPDYEILRKLPYLRGVVKESLRCTHGVISGMPRVVTANGATIDGNFIPPKTIVATSSFYVHMDPTVFPEPEKFDPERWATDDPQLERAFVPFSKGRRMCPASK